MNDRMEFRVWTEGSDLVDVALTMAAARSAMNCAISRHVIDDECEGCGVLTDPADHGFHIQVCEGDQDVTGHYYG